MHLAIKWGKYSQSLSLGIDELFDLVTECFFKDTDILLWFQNISHYNDGMEVVAVAARDIKEGEEVKSSSQTSRTNISALQI